MKTGKRHALLVFKTRYRKNRGLYFIVALGLLALYAALHLLPATTWVNTPWVSEFDWLLVLAGIVVLVIAVIRVIAGRVPYVQCSQRNVKIQTPFYPIVISYKRIQETRPNTLFHIFGNAKLSRGEKNTVLGDKVGGQTALIVDIASWPMALRWMKFWMGNLMITPDNRSLVLWVEDWMGLNRDLSTYKDQWRERQRRAREGQRATSVASQVMHKK